MRHQQEARDQAERRAEREQQEEARRAAKEAEREALKAEKEWRDVDWLVAKTEKLIAQIAQRIAQR